MPKSVLSNPGGVHLSESNFRRYEKQIERFLSTFPEPYITTPTSVSVATYVKSIREAVNAVLTHDFATTLDVVELRRVWPLVQVSPRGSTIVIASREAQRVAQVIAEAVSGGSAMQEILNPRSEDIYSLFVLFSSGALRDPIRLVGTVPEFTPPPGHAAEAQPDGSWIIL